MKVREIIEATRGNLISGDPDTAIKTSRISADSRSMRKGDLFIALSGVNFDGNDFISDAFRKGAIGAVVRAPWRTGQGAKDGKIIIEVRDTTKALQDIAHHHRMKFDIPVIGVTGSSGKTTVKEMIWTALSAGYNVLKNEGTKNNHIGVPQTLLKLNKGHDICVLEMGTNHPGEIRLLAGIARPSAAVITNIGPSHLEFLKDLKGVFDAKREILEHLADSGLLILNGDDPFLSRIKDIRFDIVRFGLSRFCDVRATSVNVKGKKVRFTVNGAHAFTINALGAHNVYNALATIAVASSFGVKIGSVRRSLSGHAPSNMRLDLMTVGGIDIINDSYNSNPLSMNSALEALKVYQARRKWVVTGDMLELGGKGKYFHGLLGEAIARSGASGLMTFGELSRYTFIAALKCGMDKKSIWHCERHEDIVSILRRIVRKGDAVLIKGSRGMKMERVVDMLIKNSKFKFKK